MDDYQCGDHDQEIQLKIDLNSSPKSQEPSTRSGPFQSLQNNNDLEAIQETDVEKELMTPREIVTSGDLQKIKN